MIGRNTQQTGHQNITGRTRHLFTYAEEIFRVSEGLLDGKREQKLLFVSSFSISPYFITIILLCVIQASKKKKENK